MQGASVKQTRSVCSERARTPTGGRSRCVFANQIRGFSAQTISPIWMRCLSNLSRPCPAPTDSPNRGESRRIELCAGRGCKENAAATQSGTRFPNGGPGGKCVPESALRLGRSFRMVPQAEIVTWNRAVERGILSQWRPRRKVHPRIAPQNGTCFPPAVPSTPKPARPPSQNWVEEGQNAIAGGQHDCRR